MNRRQFLGASLAGIIAALSLPFERFAEWCGGWLNLRHRRDLERVFVTVRDFGAVGDGVTDDTRSIQAAIAHVAERGGTVAFPNGLYRISQTLTVPASARWLDLDGSGSQVLTDGERALHVEDGAQDVLIRNFWFRGRTPLS